MSRKGWTCKCRATTAVLSGRYVDVSGPGWRRNNCTGDPQWIVCHECGDQKLIGLGVRYVESTTRSEPRKEDQDTLEL